MRDLSINSLYLNINDKSVEDPTGEGLEDIHDCILRTPRDPVMTFLYDPIRLLRTIRIAGDYQYELAPDVKQAYFNEKVREAFTNKISPERIGRELNMILSNQDSKLLMELNMLPLIFRIPEAAQEQIELSFRIAGSFNPQVYDDEHRLKMCYAALLFPFRDDAQEILHELRQSKQISRFVSEIYKRLDLLDELMQYEFGQLSKVEQAEAQLLLYKIGQKIEGIGEEPQELSS